MDDDGDGDDGRQSFLFQSRTVFANGARKPLDSLLLTQTTTSGTTTVNVTSDVASWRKEWPVKGGLGRKSTGNRHTCYMHTGDGGWRVKTAQKD